LTLERSITFPQAVIYGVGVIVGTGIYTLIGVGAGIAGNLLWLSFIIAGVIASLTALSYAKLSTLFAKESAESFYAQKAFGSRKISFLTGYLAVIVWLFSVATVSWGLVAYTKSLIPIEPIIVVLASIILFSIINYLGIQQSVVVNNVLTTLTLFGLLLIIFFGIPWIGKVNLLEGPNGLNLIENTFSLGNNLFSAAALIFFAFLGFEGLANLAGETKNPKKTIPLAILLSLFIVTILYVLISIIAVSVVPTPELYASAFSSSSNGPLALVAERLISPEAGFLLTLIAFCAIGSTLIVLLNVASRILYGMSKQNIAPKMFEYINPKTKTPSVAVIIVCVFSCLFALFGDIELLGYLCTMSIFLLFAMVNISAIVIYRGLTPFSSKKSFIIKDNIIPLLGTIFCLIMLLTQYWKTTPIFGVEVPLIAVLLVVMLIGRGLYFFLDK
jgi:APA family basic amino acid/polyamine antiporter